MGSVRRSIETREKILDVAETQFAVKGYTGAHLQSIAAEVGVQKTALYYYFPSKEALYVSVLARMLEHVERAVAVATSRGVASAESMELLLDEVNHLLAEHPNYSQILIRIFVDRIEIDSTSIEPLIERIINPLLGFYSAGVGSSAFRKLSARHAFLTILGAATFHYAAGKSSSDILGIEDVFSADAVEWRRKEFRDLVTRGVLPTPAGD